MFARDADDAPVNTSVDVGEDAESGDESSFTAMMNQNMQNAMTMMTGSDSGAENFEELMAGTESTVSPVVTDSYDLLYGAWPENYDEVVLVLDEQNSIPTDTPLPARPHHEGRIRRGLRGDRGRRNAGSV